MSHSNRCGQTAPAQAPSDTARPAVRAPHFHLKNVYDDGTESEPMIIPIAAGLPAGVQMGRRGFLQTGVAAAGFMVMVSEMIRGAPARRTLGDEDKPAALRNGLMAHTKAINALAVTLNGRYLASASDDRLVKLWLLPEGRYFTTLPRASAAVMSLATSPGDDLLIAGSSDGAVRVFSIARGGMEVGSWNGGAGLTAVAVGAGGKVLMSGGKDGQIQVSTLPNGPWGQRRLVADRPDPIKSLAGRFGGVTVASAHDVDTSSLRLGSLNAAAAPAVLEGHTKKVNCVTISADGAVLASASADKTVRLWSAVGGRPMVILDKHADAVNAAAFSRNGKLLASAGDDKTVRLWTAPDGKEVTTLKGHEAPVTALIFTPDNKILASADRDGVILLWDLVTFELRARLADPSASTADSKGMTYRATQTLRLDGIDTTRTIFYSLPCGTPLPTGATCQCNCVEVSRMRVPADIAAEQQFAAARDRAGQMEIARAQARSDAEMRAMEREQIRANAAEEARMRKEEAEFRREEERIRREEEAFWRNNRQYPVPVNPPMSGGGGGGTVCTCNSVCICLAVPVCQAHRLLDPDPVVRTMARQLLLSMGSRERTYLRWAEQHAKSERLQQAIAEITREIESNTAPDPAAWPAPAECLPYLDHPDEVVAIMAAQSLRHQQHCVGMQVDAAHPGKIEHLLAAASERPWQVRYGVV